MAKSIHGQSNLFSPTTCEGSCSAISSPASAGGATPCDSPAGLTTEPCGPEAAPVSRSRVRGKVLGATMPAIFGRRGFGSSESAALSSSLVSRLKARLPTAGSTLFSMIWKEKTTPRHRSVFLLRASARSTAGRECGSWPTPVVNDTSGSGYCYSGGDHSKIALKLPGAARLAIWNSPKTSDIAGPRQEDGKRSVGLNTQASWATPTTRDHKDTGGALSNVPINALLGRQVQLASWASPTAGEKCRSEEFQEGRTLNAAEALGPMPSGSRVGTASSGPLNPAHSRWLMGYPPAWDACAVTAMPSSRKSRQK